MIGKESVKVKSLRIKINVGLVLILVLLLGLTMNSYLSMKNSNQNMEAIMSNDLPYLINNEKLILNIAERLAVLRGYLLSGDKQYKEKFIELSQESQQIESVLLEFNDENLNNLIQKSINWSGIVQTQILELYERGDKKLALHFLELEAGPLGEEIMQEISHLSATNQENILAQGKTAIASNERILTINLYVSIIAVIIGILVATIIPRIIVNPVLKIVNRVEQVAKGNLNKEKIKVKSNDEIGKLASSINQMVINLRNLIMKTNKIADQVTNSAKKLSVSSGETSKATELIAGAIQEVAAGSETQVKNTETTNQLGKEILSKIKRIEENIKEIVVISNETTEKSETGKEVINSTKKQMEVINNRTKELQGIMDSLSSKSEEIGKIIGLISDITKQTNVLALNAVIEAERANENGKAFSVVANEVGKLAQKSNESANLISELIKGIQNDIEKTVIASDSTYNAVVDGMQLVGEAGEEFNNITNSIRSVEWHIENASDSVNEIANSVELLVVSNAENAKIAKINSDHTQNIAASAEEQHALMEEISASANYLLSEAEELKNNLQAFKL